MIIIKNRKEILRHLVFVVVGIAVGTTLHFQPFFSVFKTVSNEDFKVIIDAGHGLPDGGTVGAGGTIEQKINLEVSKKLKEILKAKKIDVIMTRKDENCLCDDTENKSIRDIKKEDMKKRLEIMKESDADLFLCIHMNYFEKTDVNGLRLFYDSKHKETKSLAEKIQSRMAEVTGAGVYAIKAADKNLFLMKNPPVPSVLIECGFLSNPEEEKKLTTEDYQARIAWAIADAVESYYNKL